MWKVQRTYCLLIRAVRRRTVVPRSKNGDPWIGSRRIVPITSSLCKKKPTKNKNEILKEINFRQNHLQNIFERRDLVILTVKKYKERHYSCYTFSPLGWMHLVLNRGLRRLLLGDRSPFWATGARRVDWWGGVGFMGDLSLVVICPARHERGIL